MLLLGRVLVAGWVLFASAAAADGMSPESLGVIYSLDDAASTRTARYYAARRKVPDVNLVGVHVPARAVIDRTALNALRGALNAALPGAVQAVLLVWSRPYAVECMSITTAVAAGYLPGFCEPGCARTSLNPLYDTMGWLPADTTGWLPAMLLPSDDETLARAVIERGIASDATHPSGTAYLIRTEDGARNVRADGYQDTVHFMTGRLGTLILTTPVAIPPADIVAYFTGIDHVQELSRLRFRPGAVADHLTSAGGVLEHGSQMSALAWLEQGATASYGSVSEPCNHPGKFPSPGVFLDHYLRGDTLLEAYWKSVAMPGQGLFIGEPLARPYAPTQ